MWGQAERRKDVQRDGGGGQREIKIAKRREIRQRCFLRMWLSRQRKGSRGNITTRWSSLTPATMCKRSSKTKPTIIMEGRSSTQSFSNLQHHRHRPSSFPVTLSGFQGPDAGYPHSHSAQDSQDQHGGRGEESTASFLASNSSTG
ncbi:hypothetical protein CRENBAI_011247, partial [Crenichthys baileyi]